MPTATAEAKNEVAQARVYSDLGDLVRKEGVAINSGAERAYAVTTGEKSTRYVVTNSPGNAALAVVTVDRISQKGLLTEALKAVGK